MSLPALSAHSLQIFQLFPPFIWKHELLLTISLGMKSKALSFSCETKDRNMLRPLFPNWLSLKSTMGETLRTSRQVRPKPISLISDSFYLVEHPLLPSQQNRSIPMPLLFKRLNWSSHGNSQCQESWIKVNNTCPAHWEFTKRQIKFLTHSHLISV